MDHKLTEKRADVGVVKFDAQSTDVSDGSTQKKADERIPLFPKYDAVLPNHMTFKYYEPSKDVGPQHTPEKIKNPGRWRFYEVDLNSVREQLARDIYIGGAEKLNKDAYQDHEEFLDLLHLYVDHFNNKKPAPGQYNVELPEKHVPGVDFDKMKSRDAEFDEDLDEKDVEGDVLILDPNQVPEHVPGPDFAK